MESRLVKILEGEVRVDQLTKENIAEYVQAKNAVESYDLLIVEPYEAFLKERKEKVIIDSPELSLFLKDRTNQQKHSPKEVISLLESFLNTALENNQNGMQMYGVRKFGDVPTVDASYVLGIFTQWQDRVLDTSVSTTVGYKGDLVERIAADSAHRLIFMDYEPARYRAVKMPDVELYIAAAEQVKAITDRLIKPFETAVREQAETDSERTVFDTKVYDNLAVQVKSVPRRESGYDALKKRLSKSLTRFSQMSELDVDGRKTFYNAELVEPRTYVAIDSLLATIGQGLAKKEVKQRQEIAVLYMPQRAIVLSVE